MERAAEHRIESLRLLVARQRCDPRGCGIGLLRAPSALLDTSGAAGSRSPSESSSRPPGWTISRRLLGTSARDPVIRCTAASSRVAPTAACHGLAKHPQGCALGCDYRDGHIVEAGVGRVVRGLERQPIDRQGPGHAPPGTTRANCLL